MKILKKLATLAITVAIATSFTVTAYSQTNNEDENYIGSWNQNLFHHYELDINIFLPVGWFPQSLDDITLVQNTIDITTINTQNYQPIMTASSSFGDVMMYLSQYTLPANTTVEEAAGILTDYLFEIGMDHIQFFFSEVVEIGSHSWYKYQGPTVQGNEIVQVTGLFTVVDGVLTRIEVLSWDPIAPSNLVALIYYIDQDAPDWFIKKYISNQNNHPLVANWSWDGNESWWYELFINSLGLRGFYGSETLFRWFISYDEQIFIVIPDVDEYYNFVELWDYDIDGNVLTLTSMQVEDMEFRYYRVD
jgi:hypothetical protein